MTVLHGKLQGEFKSELAERDELIGHWEGEVEDGRRLERIDRGWL